MTYTRQFKEPISLQGYTQASTGPAQEVVAPVEFAGTRTGTRVENYRDLIRKGAQASSPYSLDRYELLKSDAGTVDLTVVNTLPPYDVSVERFRGHAFGISQGDLAHLVPDTSTAEADSLGSLLAKLRSTVSHFKGASFVAEAVDVLRQFGSPMRSIIDLTNKRLNRLELERRGLSGSVSFKRTKWHEIVASTYLEYAFGLGPLISEAGALAEALARFNKYDPPDLRKRLVSRGQTVKASTEYWSPTQIGNVRIRLRRSNTKTTTSRCQYSVGLQGSLQAAFQSNERLVQLTGFKPADWIPAAWEVVPWSWLVDYFLNVGDILEAAVTDTSSVSWICKTTSLVTEYSRVNLLLPSSIALPYREQSLVGNHGGSFTVRRTSLTRTIPLTLGVPPLVYRHPFASPTKLANMAAVLIAREPSSSKLWLT